MPRIQALLIVVAAVGLFGCGERHESSKTVAAYLHDIDSANAQLDKYHRDPTKYATDPDVTNASAAVAAVTNAKVRACWPSKGRVATATTNHACLDAQGYTR